MKVCIAEKPSVATEIAKVLGARIKKDGYYEGNGYQVTWTFGHLCTLKKPGEYYPDWKRWSRQNLPMIPPRYDIRLIDDPGVKKQFKIIKELYKEADVIINCGDAGQEGELIQRWVMSLAGVRCPVQRLWISSLTEEAIREGFRNLVPQDKYDSLYAAGLARAEGDWLLGMNCSQLYTLKYGGYKQTLSVGRVQTPTLAMIVELDKKIENFQPSPYWMLTTKYRDTVFSCVKGKFQNEQDGKRLYAAVYGQPFHIVDIQQKRCHEQIPQLYDLTSLQVDCNKKFGMSAEQTLKNIQDLYEKKLTTYPRVDTKFLTDDIYSKCPDILRHLAPVNSNAQALAGKVLPKSKRVFDNSKVTDHHAIIPTGEISNLAQIPEYERKVYDLIVRRFIAIFYPECEYAQTTVLGRTGDIDFKATGKSIINLGWRIVYGKTLCGEEEDRKEEADNQTLPIFNLDEFGSHQPSFVRKMTVPPKRFTEASLLQAMETAGKFVEDETLREAMKENGLGRPSSRANIIETLLKREYIRREKKNIVSNPTGRDLINIIQEPMLKSPELTGQWEKKLRDIEHGKYSLTLFMNELQQQLVSIIKGVDGDNSGRKVAGTYNKERATSGYRGNSHSSEANVGDRCPVCGKGVIRKGPYGLYCDQYKISGCKYRG